MSPGILANKSPLPKSVSAPVSSRIVLESIADDEYYETIRQYVLDSQTASTSSIMRHFGLGYGRAASILDSLEEEGIVKTIGNGRKVVIKKTDDADSDF